MFLKELKAKEMKISCGRIVSASIIIGKIKTVVASVYLHSTNHNLTDYLNIKDLLKFVIAVRAEWKQAGSPRQISNAFYMKYKELKCEYRCD